MYENKEVRLSDVFFYELAETLYKNKGNASKREFCETNTYDYVSRADEEFLKHLLTVAVATSCPSDKSVKDGDVTLMVADFCDWILRGKDAPEKELSRRIYDEVVGDWQCSNVRDFHTSAVVWLDSFIDKASCASCIVMFTSDATYHDNESSTHLIAILDRLCDKQGEVIGVKIWFDKDVLAAAEEVMKKAEVDNETD